MDHLLDTSWTLHYISTNSTSYRHLFDPSTTQHHLSRYFDRLPQFLTSQKPQYTDELNNESEKVGSFRECKYTISTLPASSSTTTRTGPIITTIHLQLLYQHTTFTFTLLTPHLILSKAPTSHTKYTTNFLSETFNISIDALKFPSTFLCESVQTYISTLTAAFGNDHDNDIDALLPEKRAAVLRAAIGTLKLTVSFSGTVAPHLRTLDLSVPYETVDVLVSESVAQSRSGGFMEGLVEHLHLQTGLRLPLVNETEVEGEGGVFVNGRAGSMVSDSSTTTKTSPFKLSKVTSAAFALSVEGKLRFAAKAVENAVERENLVTMANIQTIEGIVNFAKRKGATRH